MNGRELSPVITEEKLGQILEINGQSGFYNLALTEKDVLELAEEQRLALAYAGRLEFGFETLEAVINEFYKSPYINQFEYAEIIGELLHLFYALKNEAGDALADEELLKLMSGLFDGPCNGSLELLMSRGAEYIMERANRKTRWRYERKRRESVPPSPVGDVFGLTGGSLAIAYTPERQVRIAESLAEILRELSMRRTGGRSFSISVEAAQSIAGSVMYAAELSGMGKLYEPGALRTAYEKGLAEIGAVYERAKRLYNSARKTRTSTRLLSYNTVLDEELPAFINNYDCVFAAADVPALSYYPVFTEPRLQGVSYISGYLESLIIENEYCAALDGGELDSLLASAAGREWQPNIFGLAVTNGIFAVIIGKRHTDVALTSVHRAVILSELKNIAESGINLYTVIEETAAEVAKAYENASVGGYIEKFAAQRLKKALERECSAERAADLAVYGL